MAVAARDAVALAMRLLGTPYGSGAGQILCDGVIIRIIRTGTGGVPAYRTASTNALWQSQFATAKYRDITAVYALHDARAVAGMLAVKKSGDNCHHVGLCCGDGTIIHASSAKEQVVRTPLTAKEGWTHLLVHRYIAPSQNKEDTPMDVVQYGIVKTAKTALNLRSAPMLGDNIVTEVARGTRLALLSLTPEAGFYPVKHGAVVLYASAAYVTPLGAPDASEVAPEPDAVLQGTITVPREVLSRALDAYMALAQAIEELRPYVPGDD